MTDTKPVSNNAEKQGMKFAFADIVASYILLITILISIAFHYCSISCSRFLSLKGNCYFDMTIKYDICDDDIYVFSPDFDYTLMLFRL